MTERLSNAFERARAANRPALMPYVTAGDPTRPPLEDILVAIAEAGADVVEIGFPFSDPIADGPVIASAMHRALEAGLTPPDVLRAVAAARTRTDVPFVGMVSESIVNHRGHDRFVSEAAASGFDGLIVPDADFDHLDELSGACRNSGVALVPLVAPSTGDDRLERLLDQASGFIYLLARAGVTGVRDEAPEVADGVRRVRAVSELPIAVGFGVSNAEHVRTIGRDADGAIVGSALVRRLHEADAAGEDVADAAAEFVRALQ